RFRLRAEQVDFQPAQGGNVQRGAVRVTAAQALPRGHVGNALKSIIPDSCTSATISVCRKAVEGQDAEKAYGRNTQTV
ncbi:MAG: hypothetical protein NTY86_02960, partial [Deltaproteobacteria bacterium]|nr:hypothetical protein [Deltaproteobacteria bacterium]